MPRPAPVAAPSRSRLTTRCARTRVDLQPYDPVRRGYFYRLSRDGGRSWSRLHFAPAGYPRFRALAALDALSAVPASAWRKGGFTRLVRVCHADLLAAHATLGLPLPPLPP